MFLSLPTDRRAVTPASSEPEHRCLNRGSDTRRNPTVEHHWAKATAVRIYPIAIESTRSLPQTPNFQELARHLRCTEHERNGRRQSFIGFV